VEHGVAGAVGGGGAAVRLAALAVLERLAAERALVDLALLGAREGETVVLELEDRVGCEGEEGGGAKVEASVEDEVEGCGAGEREGR